MGLVFFLRILFLELMMRCWVDNVNFFAVFNFYFDEFVKFCFVVDVVGLMKVESGSELGWPEDMKLIRMMSLEGEI